MSANDCNDIDDDADDVVDDRNEAKTHKYTNKYTEIGMKFRIKNIPGDKRGFCDMRATRACTHNFVLFNIILRLNCSRVLRQLFEHLDFVFISHSILIGWCECVQDSVYLTWQGICMSFHKFNYCGFCKIHMWTIEFFILWSRLHSNALDCIHQCFFLFSLFSFEFIR